MTLADPVSPDLKRHLRTLKLGQLLATLPDRLTLARQQKLPHADFLELLLSDEVTRRENGSAARRARAAGLAPDMRIDTWDPTAAVRYDQQLWNELVSLRSQGSCESTPHFPGVDSHDDGRAVGVCGMSMISA